MNRKPLKTYLFAPFKLDLEKGYLYREDGEEVELTATPRKILEFMLENTGEQGDTLFTRDKIIGGVWGNVVVESATLDKHIAALRKAFGRGERDQSVIETKHREGYRFKLPVRRVYGDGAESFTAPSAITAPEAESYEIFPSRAFADTFVLW